MLGLEGLVISGFHQASGLNDVNESDTQPPEPRRKRGRPVGTCRAPGAAATGFFLALLVVDAALSCPASLIERAEALPVPEVLDLVGDADFTIVGIACISYTLRQVSDQADGDTRCMRKQAVSSQPDHPPLGFIDYEVVEHQLFPEPVVVPDGKLDEFQSEIHRRLGRSVLQPCGKSLLSWLAGRPIEFMFCLPSACARLIAAGASSIARSVAITAHTDYSNVPHMRPSRYKVSVWRKENGLGDLDFERGSGFASALPSFDDGDGQTLRNPIDDSLHGRNGSRKAPVDPEKLFRAIAFSKFLSSQEDFSEAVDAAADYADFCDNPTAPNRSTQRFTLLTVPCIEAV